MSTHSTFKSTGFFSMLKISRCYKLRFLVPVTSLIQRVKVNWERSEANSLLGANTKGGWGRTCFILSNLSNWELKKGMKTIQSIHSISKLIPIITNECWFVPVSRLVGPVPDRSRGPCEGKQVSRNCDNTMALVLIITILGMVATKTTYRYTGI